MVGAQLREAALQTGDQLASGIVIGPNLGSDEEVLARNTALGDGLADFCLVAVDLRGVD